MKKAGNSQSSTLHSPLIPPGYKQTEVGVIPEDWKVKSIQQLFDEGAILDHLDGNHGELYPRSHEFKDYGVPYIGANDFTSGNVNLHNCKFLAPERAALFRKGVAKDGDVLFAHNATVGPVALLRTKEPFVILSTTATYFRCDRGKLDNLYLSAALQSRHFVKQYQAVMAQSTRFQIPITTQRKLSLVVASLPEQHAIATALSDVDALLDGLDRLIAKKRDIKQAAMQQLLTGKTRLPGFEGEWVMKRLEELANIRNGGTPSTSQSHFWDGGIPWCTPTDITALNEKKYLYETTRTITKAGLHASSAESIPTNSIIMTTRATIGECAINVVPMTTNQGFKNLVPYENVDSEFLYYLMLTQKDRLMTLCAGSTFLEIGKKQLTNFAVYVPIDIDEQTAIATVLSDMDTEIEALEHRRAKTRDLKQAMMQELLTGRIRLVEPAAVSQPEPEVKRQPANIHFKRSVLAAEIVSQLHSEPTFGHVKFEKMIFLVEHLCNVETGSTYYRQAAGPYDNRALRSIDSQMKKQKY